MADPEIRILTSNDDVEMEGGENNVGVEVAETGAQNGDEGEKDEAVDGAGKEAPRTSFIDYLKSPIVEIVVGEGEEQTILSAHHALLIQSPFLASAIAESPNRRIKLADDDLDAVSCFLEYLYTGEYFPHKTASGTLQPDPTQPTIDDSGVQLLKHAKVYTLAEKLSIDALKTLSHSKIHLITSTAIAEIAYARYVYTNTSRSDLTIRKPVASFWGQRSHVLRHETEGSFRAMCLEYPEFAFDVLSFVLDVEEKREKRREGDDGGRSARKRRVGER